MSTGVKERILFPLIVTLIQFHCIAFGWMNEWLLFCIWIHVRLFLFNVNTWWRCLRRKKTHIHARKHTHTHTHKSMHTEIAGTWKFRSHNVTVVHLFFFSNQFEYLIHLPVSDQTIFFWFVSARSMCVTLFVTLISELIRCLVWFDVMQMHAKFVGFVYTHRKTTGCTSWATHFRLLKSDYTLYADRKLMWLALRFLFLPIFFFFFFMSDRMSFDCRRFMFIYSFAALFCLTINFTELSTRRLLFFSK